MELNWRKTSILTAMAGLIAVAPDFAQADFPEKEVTMIVNAGAGGSTDAGARILARAMEKSLGQPVVVINKPGGGGTKGALLLTKETPDGYTIGYTFSHNLTFAAQYKRDKPLYSLGDFDYLGSITDPRLSIVSLAGRGWSTLKEMVAKLKSENSPLRLVYSGGAGRLIGNAIKADFGIETKIIRVRGGGKSMQRVLGGHVDVVYTGGAHTPYTEAGQTVVIASVDQERNPDYPDVPTYHEQGGNAATTSLQIVYAPEGLTQATRSKLADAVTTASRDPKVNKLFGENLKMRVHNARGDDLRRYLEEEYERYTKLIAAYSD